MNKNVRKWICVFFAFVFLISSTSMSIQQTFYSDVVLINLSRSAIVSSILTLVFALSAIPKWQAFFGLAVFVYSVIWEATSSIGIH